MMQGINGASLKERWITFLKDRFLEHSLFGSLQLWNELFILNLKCMYVDYNLRRLDVMKITN